MQLKESFWREYRSRYGEPPDVFDSLGYEEIELRLENNGIAEHVVVNGNGYVPNFSERGDERRIEIVLNSLRQYNIISSVVRTVV
ncbi:MAG: hypothetical protein ISS36_04150 [Candidatus Aenigmarchaeota archaeon]|nr:hypothetical protein [Candidatus Aenigmarchaeota archaeon]